MKVLTSVTIVLAIPTIGFELIRHEYAAWP